MVLTRAEVRTVLEGLTGTSWLVAGLLYGSGLRLLEGLRLRVKDVDFSAGTVHVRAGMGAKDRITLLPTRAAAPLELHLEHVRHLHERDLAAGFGTVELPHAFARKHPGAARSWNWQYVFPGSRRGIDPRSGEVRRHHLAESVVQKAVARQYERPASRSGRAATPSDIRSPLICWRTDTTSAPCRNCSGTRTCAPP